LKYFFKKKEGTEQEKKQLLVFPKREGSKTIEKFEAEYNLLKTLSTTTGLNTANPSIDTVNGIRYIQQNYINGCFLYLKEKVYAVNEEFINDIQKGIDCVSGKGKTPKGGQKNFNPSFLQTTIEDLVKIGSSQDYIPDLHVLVEINTGKVVVIDPYENKFDFANENEIKKTTIENVTKLTNDLMKFITDKPELKSKVDKMTNENKGRLSMFPVTKTILKN